MTIRSVPFWWAATLSLLLIGCKEASPPPAPPPPSVTVSRPVVEEVVVWDEYEGRLESPKLVHLSARVSGIIESAPFDEGSLVKEGDPLFVIDSRPFLADLKSKEADLSRARALIAQAEAHYHRYEKLRGTKAIAAEDYEEALAALLQARAAVAVAEAARDVSKLSLDWTRVTSPITGKVSRKYVTEGNLISGGGGQATRLTTITSVDPLFAYATIPERAFLAYQSLREERRKLAAPGPAPKVPFLLKLEGEETFGRRGYIDFVDNRVDPTTGTVQIRGVLPNPEGALTPGLFARIRVPGSLPKRTVLIPDKAVATNQDSRFVLVAGNDGAVEARTIELGPLFGRLRAVVQGLTPEDRVIVVGVQQAKPGGKVKTEEAPVDTSSLEAFRPSSLEEPKGAS